MEQQRFEKHFLMESVAFGITDGIICFLSLIVGVARAASNPILVITATIVGGIGDALGNSIGFFVSQATERAVQIYETQQGANMRVHSKREVWMSGVFSFLATGVTLALLLAPFAFLPLWPATTFSFLIGTISAFILGTYIGKLNNENPYKSGIKYACITIAGALISYFVGEALNFYLKIS